jgi:hypothetical protein
LQTLTSATLWLLALPNLCIFGMFYMFIALGSISYLSINSHVIMMLLLNFTLPVSLLRIEPRGGLFFMVIVMTVFIRCQAPLPC